LDTQSLRHNLPFLMTRKHKCNSFHTMTPWLYYKPIKYTQLQNSDNHFFTRESEEWSRSDTTTRSSRVYSGYLGQRNYNKCLATNQLSKLPFSFLTNRCDQVHWFLLHYVSKIITIMIHYPNLISIHEE
jgi:hypothetical protein